LPVGNTLILAGRQLARPGEVEQVTGEDAESEWRSEVADISGISLTRLAELTGDEESSLARSLRRLTDELANPDEPIAGFNSAL
jgi:FXSXX-COOH protein